jgi:hypothetical protein
MRRNQEDRIGSGNNVLFAVGPRAPKFNWRHKKRSCKDFFFTSFPRGGWPFFSPRVFAVGSPVNVCRLADPSSKFDPEFDFDLQRLNSY